MPPEVAGGGHPVQFLEKDFAGRVGVNEGLDAPFAAQSKQSGAGFVNVGEGAEDNVETSGSLLDGGFGEAHDCEKAAGDSGIADGVEARGGFGLVSRGGGAGIEVGAGSDGDFDVEERTFGLDNAVPAERGAGLGEGRDFVGEFAAIDPGLQGGDDVAVKSEARGDVEDESDEGEARAETATRAFAASTDFFGDEAAEEREKDSGEEDSEDPKVERREPVQREAARGEWPEEFDAGGLANIETEVKKGGRKHNEKDGSARDGIFGGFRLDEEERKSGENADCKSSKERMKVSSIEGEIRGRTEVSAEEVSVGDDARQDNRDCGCAREARESGAL